MIWLRGSNRCRRKVSPEVYAFLATGGAYDLRASLGQSFFVYIRRGPADEEASMMHIGNVAAALGGELAGHNTILCPGPGHAPKDRSLSVKLDPTAPDGFLTYSHAGDDWRLCRDHVRARLGLPPW